MALNARATAVLLTATFILTSAVHAQGSAEVVRRVLPQVRFFPSLLADPLEPHLGVGLLKTNLFVNAPEGKERVRGFFLPDPDDSRFDVNAVTSIGGTLPFWLLKQWSPTEGLLFGATAGVIGRFRIEYPTREDVGQDWFVGMPIEYARGRWQGRFRIMHRSSHIGDELVETTGISRVESGGEFADFMAAFRLTPETRVYGGASWIFRSYTQELPALIALDRQDRTVIQLGAETGWYPWLGGHGGIFAGVDWRTAERTGWQSSLATAAGVNIRTATRSGRLVARYFTGVSLLDQFFLTKENYWSLELVTEF